MYILYMYTHTSLAPDPASQDPEGTKGVPRNGAWGLNIGQHEGLHISTTENKARSNQLQITHNGQITQIT